MTKNLERTPASKRPRSTLVQYLGDKAYELVQKTADKHDCGIADKVLTWCYVIVLCRYPTEMGPSQTVKVVLISITV